ncbi:hypothetical protein [Luteolibacter sp. AS25]|uniref:hypothetical protein n=1 Tax=Luteolibacter sp. AS25 TaxID=3135776 RepID=UPI00398A892F
MAGKVSRSTKQILSVLFHIVVLISMVLIYDAGKLFSVKLGIIEAENQKSDMTAEDAMDMNFMEHEETLETKIDRALNKLILKVDGGYLLRTDLPFPPHLKVVVTETKKLKKVRIAGKSRFGDEIDTLSARMDDVTEYEMAGKAVRVTKRDNVSRRLLSIQELQQIEVAAEKAIAAGLPAPERTDKVVDKLKGKAVQFNNKGKGWAAVPTTEFITRSWASELEPNIDEILTDNGLRPAKRWFGRNPLKLGSKQKLSGASLDLVIKDAASGSLDLEMIGVEGVHGHPCAVFSMEGSMTMKPYENDLGQIIETETTVDEGKIWFSLLYPIVLRKEMDTIQSTVTKESGKKVGIQQGAVEDTLHVNWKAVNRKAK